MINECCKETNTQSFVDVNCFLKVFENYYIEGVKEKRYFFLGGNFSKSDFFQYSVPFDSIQLSSECLEIEDGKFYFILWWDSVSAFEKDPNEAIYYLYMKNDKDINIDFRFVIEFNNT